MPPSSSNKPTREVVDLLAAQPMPLPLNAVRVDQEGHISAPLSDRMLFTFVFDGALFDVVAETSGPAIRLSLRADLGPLPFSAEHVGARHALIRVIGESNQRLAISDVQNIQAHGMFEVPQPATPIHILTEITSFLLAVKPDLVRVAEHLPAARRQAAQPAN